MKKMKRWLALVLALAVLTGTLTLTSAASDNAQTNATYYNNAAFSAADPAVMHDPVSGNYYVYSTDGATSGTRFGIFRSADLVTWERLNGAMPSTGQWGNDWFWAPECYYNEKTGWYFLFYAARIRSNTDLCEQHFGFRSFDEACKVGVAVSRSPEGPFTNIASTPIDYYPYDPNYYDVNQIMPNVNTPPKTLEEGMTAPKGTYLPYIDPNVYFDDNGKIYLYFSRNCYRDWVWDPDLGKYLEESNIYAVELTTDWWTDPDAKTLPAVAPAYRNVNKAPTDAESVRKDGFFPVINYAMEKQEWENAHINRVPTNRRWAEGSTTIKYYFDKNGDGIKEPYYYMFYSCNNWENEWYGVGYAVASNPLGPWNKYDLNPIIKLNADMSGTGHGSVAWSPDGSELFYVYHARPGITGGRRLYQDRLFIDETKIDADTGLPTVSVKQSANDQPVPSGVAPYLVKADTSSLRLQPAGTSQINFTVQTAQGTKLALSNALNRVVATIDDPSIATVTATTAGAATVTAVSEGQATLTLQYQRRSSDGSYYDVTNTVNGVTTPAKLTVPIAVMSKIPTIAIDKTQAAINENFTVSVETDVNVAKLLLANENGMPLSVKSLTSRTEDDKKIFTATMCLGTAGNDRQIRVALDYGKGKGYVDSGVFGTIDITKTSEAPKVLKVEAPATALVNVAANYAITTNLEGSYSANLRANGASSDLGKTVVSKTMNPDGSFTWVIAVKIGTAGNRALNAYAGNSIGTRSDPYPFALTVKLF